MNDLREETRSQVKRGIEVTGLTSTQLAREAGLAPSTLNNFLNRDVKHNLSMTSITKVSEAVYRVLRTSGKSKAEAKKDIAYYNHGNAASPLEPVAVNAITIDVRGSVQAGHWTEAVEWPQGEWEYVTVPRPPAHKSYFGLKVKGPSMNKEYPEGTILVCVPIWDYRQAVESGDHVIVRRRNGDGRSEATVKELVIDEDGRYWLWPRSNHPEHQQPIEVPAANVEEHDAEDEDEIRVTAIVVADYRIRQRRKRHTG